MSRITRACLATGACAVLLLNTGAAPATRDKADPGAEWLAWSPSERAIYVRGFFEGYGNGGQAACKLADDLFEVGKLHHLGEAPRTRCEDHLEKYTKITISDSGLDFSAYTEVITDFYTKHPEYWNITYGYIMSLLNDRNYKTADQLYRLAVEGRISTHF